MLVCGPACGGKSTYVADHKADGDRVVDYDDIVEEIGGTRYAPTFEQQHRAAELWLIRATAPQGEGTTWLIWAAAPRWQRAKLRKQGASVIVVSAPLDVCLERARTQRPTGWDRLVLQWFSSWEPSTTSPEPVVWSA